MTGPARIGVDVGGTFTDLVLHDASSGLISTGKRLTTPQAPNRAIVDGIVELLADTRTPVDRLGEVVHGTTLITNTVLERTGARVGLITTEGFRDILEMGREIRYDTDDLYAQPAPVIVPRYLRHVVAGRMRADGTEHTPLDEKAVAKAARSLVLDSGIEALAIGFLHSYANSAHERRARDLVAESFPDLLITLSAEVAPEIGEYGRINTACLNGYVQPIVVNYLDQLEHDLAAIGFTGRLSIMNSSGGITSLAQAKAFPVQLLESGPAAGAIAAASVATRVNEPRAVSFDMGGTTAKICLVESGKPHVTHEFEAGRVDKYRPGSGLPVRITVVNMIEIGAGGGSIAVADDLGLLKVGPRSAGSVPGPIAYGRGGQLPTVTDSDLLMGYLDSDHFLGDDLELSLPGVHHAFEVLARRLGVEPRAAATGVQDLVIENMASATRMHLAEKGRDPSTYTLIAFGGAGPVHAYALAKRLKMSRIIVPPAAGVMSAFGFLIAPPMVDDVRGYPTPLAAVDWDKVAALYANMQSQALRILGVSSRASNDDVVITRTADMRYVGQGYEINVELPDGEPGAAMAYEIEASFIATYERVFGRTIREGAVELINWRLSISRRRSDFRLGQPRGTSPASRGTRLVHFEDHGLLPVDVYDRYALAAGTRVRGPALIEEHETSCSVGPDSIVTVDRDLNLVIDICPTRTAADNSHYRKGPTR